MGMRVKETMLTKSKRKMQKTSKVMIMKVILKLEGPVHLVIELMLIIKQK